ncbi:WD40 repeat-containing protein [Cavenderia fasciculata]|uniref:WD40 repeat-containing protein n=1 Tax=Cavenderia fasciculata TaxID=261658 RepID=F4QDA5_CACFS|nr:WD40 repeat-containing protein [Cavenderia fasciculata]EGG13733.1 WD40 repeat-containing protein [Cavenderia fasciculata]|eukprot:XP_004350437.1 WD40 repeat-containing protein [Cavenderia fasciculata]
MYEITKKITGAHEEGIWCVSWKGDTVATGGMSSKVKTWCKILTLLHSTLSLSLRNATSTNFLTDRKTFTNHTLGVSSLDIDENCQNFVTSGLDSHVRLWNLTDNTLSKDIDVGPLGTWSTAFSPKGDIFVTVSQKGAVNIWSSKTGDKIRTFQTGTPSKVSILNATYSPKDNHIACAGSDGVVSIYDVETGKRVNNFNAHSTSIRSICYSPDGATIFTASEDTQIRISDPLSSSGSIASFQGHSSWVLSVACSNDGKKIASGSSDRRVKIWDISTRKCDHTFQDHADQVWGVAWSPDGSKLVSVSDDCKPFIQFTLLRKIGAVKHICHSSYSGWQE